MDVNGLAVNPSKKVNNMAKKSLKDMKFDTVVMNPPYNTSRIEERLIERAKAVADTVITINPIKSSTVINSDGVYDGLESVRVLNPSTAFPSVKLSALGIFKFNKDHNGSIKLTIDDDVLHGESGTHSISDISELSLRPSLETLIRKIFTADTERQEFVRLDDKNTPSKIKGRYCVGVGSFVNFHQSVCRLDQDNFKYGDEEHVKTTSYSYVESVVKKGETLECGAKASGCYLACVVDSKEEAEKLHSFMGNPKYTELFATMVKFDRNLQSKNASIITKLWKDVEAMEELINEYL